MATSLVQKVNITELLGGLFSHLSERERDVVKRRHKLNKDQAKRETLEKIGQDYQVTRERVRQIERDGLRKLQKASQTHTTSQQSLTHLEVTVRDFLKKYGGVMAEGHLLDEVVAFLGVTTDVGYHKESLAFIISQLLSDKFERVETANHYVSWKLKETPWEFVEEVIEKMVVLLETNKEPLTADQFLTALRKQDFYQQIKGRLAGTMAEFERDVLDLDAAILAYVKTSKQIKQNLFGNVGLSHWPTISPKRMKDKIYLVMKESGEPLHFTGIAEAINQASFDKKKALPATVHNELILDDRYVLIGRGIYALREWGYATGTVTDVITTVLAKAGRPLSKDEIVAEVSKQRMVKQATINLALMNKDKYRKLSDKTYTLADRG